MLSRLPARTAAALIVVIYYLWARCCKDPEFDSSEGTAYLVRLLDGNPRRVWSRLRMSASMIITLSRSLRRSKALSDTRNLSIIEQLMIFILIASQGHSFSSVCDRVERSLETVHRYFHRVARCLCRAFSSFVEFPTSDTPISIKISHDRRFWPYFENCIGAVDGTHIPVRVAQHQTAYRDRKGNLSMNVLVACDFDMKFVYALAGWEGSSHDARVYEDALNKGFDVPNGKYFLGDAGFTLSMTCLVPYRGVRYHLREYSGTGNEPRNAQELFNLRHAQLRNVIERSIGVWKSRFRILRNCATLAPRVVTRVVYATIVLHNFIRSLCSEAEFGDVELDGDEPDGDDDDAAPAVQGPRDAITWRDAITHEMWDDYVSDRPGV
jgi:hypothetical protein